MSALPSQHVVVSSSSPGWNDPPILSGEQSHAVSQQKRRAMQQQRRPVDPSISGSGGRTGGQLIINSQSPSMMTAYSPTMLTSSGAVSFNGTSPMFRVGSPSTMIDNNNTNYDSQSPDYQSNDQSFSTFNEISNDVQQCDYHQHAAIQPSPQLYALPNTPLNDTVWHPSPPAQPTPGIRYVPPIKAAGDVSLSGNQLVAFLTKAALTIPQGATREGIQLRINQLDEQLKMARISDACQKKLNFVVDAIDRGIYYEAWEFFEQLNFAYANELNPWGQGIRLLIMELRRLHSSRQGSASSLRNQSM